MCYFKDFRRYVIILLVLVVVFSLYGIVFSTSLEPEAQKMLDAFHENSAVSEFYDQVKAAYDGTTINAIGWTGPQSEGLRNFLPVFTELTGIEVNYETFQFDLVVEKVKMDAVAKAGNYDLEEIPYQDLGWFVENGYLLPFKDFMENDKLRSPILNEDDIIWASWNASSWYDGVCYGHPSVTCTMYLWYRKDLFEDPTEKTNFYVKYGYELAPPKTWKQFREIGEFFTREQGETLAGKVLQRKVYGTAIQGGRNDALTCEWLQYTWSFGGGIFEGGITKKENLIVNSPENVAALDFYKSLLEFSPPGTLEYSYEGPTTAFQQELVVGLCVEWNDQAFGLEDPKNSAVVGKMGYGPVPMEVDLTTQGLSGVSHYGGWTQSISNNSKNPEAAYLFSQWIISPIVQTILAQKKAIAPVRNSTYSVPEVANFPPLAATGPAMADTHYRPRIPEWAEMEEEMRVALSRCLIGELSSQEALDWLYSRYMEILK